MIQEYTEWAFVANDLDSGEALTDTVDILSSINDRSQVYRIIENLVKHKHPITTLSGNTWEVEDVEPTGQTFSYNKETKEHNIITERNEYYKNIDFPLMDYA